MLKKRIIEFLKFLWKNGIKIGTLLIAIFAFWTLWIQGNYYKKTNRPFIHVTEVLIEQAESNKDLFELFFRIKNSGDLPAKDVQINTFFSVKEKRTFIEFKEGEINTAIFPNEVKRSVNVISNQPINELQSKIIKTPFLHIHIKFVGPDEKQYSYRTIRKIDILYNLEGDKINTRTVDNNKWSDFD